MITLDDVNRIKAILIAHGEWLVSGCERARVTDDGDIEWITSSCSGSALKALMDDGFSIYVWASVQYRGFLEIHIS